MQEKVRAVERRTFSILNISEGFVWNSLHWCMRWKESGWCAQLGNPGWMLNLQKFIDFRNWNLQKSNKSKEPILKLDLLILLLIGIQACQNIKPIFVMLFTIQFILMTIEFRGVKKESYWCNLVNWTYSRSFIKIVGNSQ